jgi:hypothetical protein
MKITAIKRSAFTRCAVGAIAAFILGHNEHASAGLTFEKKEVVVDATPFDKELIVEFPFKNTGETPITIKQIRSNCGCTTATLKKLEYAPGESGVIAAKFEIGVRMGEQKKPITIDTTDPKEPKIAVYLVARIPEVIKMPKSFILWKEGEDREKRSISIMTTSDFPVKDIIAKCDRPQFHIDMQRVSPTEYRMEVTPTVAPGKLVGTVQLEVVLETEQRKRAFAYVGVR